MSDLWKYILALLPSSGLLYLFYVVMKHVFEADRRERAAVAEWEAEHGRRTPEADPETSGTAPGEGENGRGATPSTPPVRRSEPTHGIPEP